MITFPRTISGIIALILRVLMGAWFIYTGWQKAKDPTAFLDSIRTFHILDDPYAAWLAMGLPWLEILAGTALVTGVLPEGGLTVIAGLLIVFLWAIIYSWQRGLDIDCGCFGRQGRSSSYPGLVIEDALQLAVAVGLLVHRWLTRRRRSERGVALRSAE